MRHSEQSDRQFWLWSALIHTIIFAVILMTPASDLIFEHERKLKPEVIRKGEELNEVVEDIRDLAVERLKEQVSLLAAGQERMGTNFDTMNKHYQKFADQQKATAKSRFTDEMFTATARMDKILRSLEAAQENPDPPTIEALEEAINENMARLLATHDEVRRSLLLTTPDDEDLLAVQTEAMDLQQEANKFFRWSLHEAKVCQRHQTTIAKAEQQIPKSKEKLAGIEQQIEQYKKEHKQAQQAEREARTAEKEARQALDDLGGKLKKAGGAVTGREKALAKLKQADEPDQAAIAKAEEALAAAKQHLSDLQAAKKAAEQERKQQQQAIKQAKRDQSAAAGGRKKADRSHRGVKRSLDQLIKSKQGAEKALPDHVAKRDYCIRKSFELQSTVKRYLDSISERFLTIIDENNPDREIAPAP